MSNNLSSPTINLAIGKLVKKHIDDKRIDILSVPISDYVADNVLVVLNCLGYLGVLDYSRFNPDLLEQALQVGNHVLEVETIEKDSN